MERVETLSTLKTSDFDYPLDRSLIAQKPRPSRDASRLMVLDHGKTHPGKFTDLPGWLRKGDLLVVNESQVIPARLALRKSIHHTDGGSSTGGKGRALVVKTLNRYEAEAMLMPAHKFSSGGSIFVEDSGVELRVIEKLPDGIFRVLFSKEIAWVLREYGRMPLPPYIKRVPDAEDEKGYQTLFAKIPGSIAAPTAGLHFTRPVLESLEKKGVGISHLWLHVGLGSFRPVRCEDPTRHAISMEEFSISDETARRIRETKESGGRVIAVGTTVLRALETSARMHGEVREMEGTTNLFVLPGFRFKVVDGLLTNFHLPRTTLLMLVCALGGRERALSAYAQAQRERFRFFSYGDAMLIWR